MDIRQVSKIDGRMCAQLINLLKAGKWELSGPDIVAHMETTRWVHELASKMAEQLKAAATPEVSAPPPIPVPKKARKK